MFLGTRRALEKAGEQRHETPYPDMRSIRLVTINRNTFQPPVRRKIIIDRLMLGTAIIPNGDAVGPPLKTAAVFRGGNVFV